MHHFFDCSLLCLSGETCHSFAFTGIRKTSRQEGQENVDVNWVEAAFIK